MGKIQMLRDEVLKTLDITDPSFNGYGNLVENVITVLEKNDKIQWKPPPGPRTLVLTRTELEMMASQVVAFQMLDQAGAELEEDQPIRVHDRILGCLLWVTTPHEDTAVVRIGAADNSLSWMTDEDYRRTYAPRNSEPDSDDE